MTKRNATQRLRALVTAIGEILGSVDAARVQYTQYVGEQYVSLGILIDEGAEIHAELNLGDWREWARAAITKAAPGAGVSVDTLYRIRNAGTVARVAGGDYSGVTYLALVPFYRVLVGKLSVAKTPEEQEQARQYVRALVAKGLETPGGLTVAVAEELTKDYAPTRGKGAKDAKTTAANRKAAKSRKAAKTAAPPEITPEDSAAREACSNAIGRILGKIDEDSRPMARTLMVGTAKLCETYSPTTVAALVKSWKAA